MSRHWDDPEEIETRIWRGLLVSEYNDDVSALDYIAAAKGWDR